MTTRERYKPFFVLAYLVLATGLAASDARTHGMTVGWWIEAFCYMSPLPYGQWKAQSAAWPLGNDIAAGWALAALVIYASLADRLGALSYKSWGPAMLLAMAAVGTAINANRHRTA